MQTQKFEDLWNEAYEAQTQAEALSKSKKGSVVYEARQLFLGEVNRVINLILGGHIEKVTLTIDTRKGGDWGVLHLQKKDNAIQPLKVPMAKLGDELKTKVKKEMNSQKAIEIYQGHMTSGAKFNRDTYDSFPRLRPGYMDKGDVQYSNVGRGGLHPNPIEVFCVEVLTQKKEVKCRMSESGDWVSRPYTAWTARFLVVKRIDSSGFYGKTHELGEDQIFVIEVEGDTERSTPPEVGEHRFGVIRDGFGVDQHIFVGGFKPKATTLENYERLTPYKPHILLHFVDGTKVEVSNGKILGDVPESHFVAAMLYAVGQW